MRIRTYSNIRVEIIARFLSWRYVFGRLDSVKCATSCEEFPVFFGNISSRRPIERLRTIMKRFSLRGCSFCRVWGTLMRTVLPRVLQIPLCIVRRKSLCENVSLSISSFVRDALFLYTSSLSPFTELFRFQRYRCWLRFLFFLFFREDYSSSIIKQAQSGISIKNFRLVKSRVPRGSEISFLFFFFFDREIGASRSVH